MLSTKYKKYKLKRFVNIREQEIYIPNNIAFYNNLAYKFSSLEVIGDSLYLTSTSLHGSEIKYQIYYLR